MDAKDLLIEQLMAKIEALELTIKVLEEKIARPAGIRRRSSWHGVER